MMSPPITLILRTLLTVAVLAGLVGGAVTTSTARQPDSSSNGGPAMQEHDTTAVTAAPLAAPGRDRPAPSPRRQVVSASTHQPDDPIAGSGDDHDDETEPGRPDPSSEDLAHTVPSEPPHDDTGGDSLGNAQDSAEAPTPPLPTFPKDVWFPEGLVIGHLDDPTGPAVPLGSTDLKVVPNLGVGGGFNGSTDLKTGVGCQLSCITSGTAVAVGVGAELTVTTDTPAKLWIIVWNDGYHHLAFAGHQLRTSFSIHLDDLAPGTTYQAMAIAQDASGAQDERYGGFTTLRRHARVQFGGVNVASGSFERFRYMFGVDGQWQDHLEVNAWPYPYYHPLGGSTIVEVPDAPAALDVRVQASARPATSKKDVCEAVILPSTKDRKGQNTCVHWGTAPGDGAAITLDGSPTDDGRPVARSFALTLSAQGQAGLDLEAIVLIDVWYA